VNLAAYLAAGSRLRDLQAEQAGSRLQQVRAAAGKTAANEMARSQRQWRRQMLGLLAAGVLVALVVVGVSLWHDHAQRLRRAREARMYEQAMACLQGEDYLCARDGFVVLLREDPQYGDAQSRLINARLGLARQYRAAGQWQAAVAELDQALRTSPTETDALSLLQDVYDAWLEDALSRGDWLTALRVQLQRDARFP